MKQKFFKRLAAAAVLLLGATTATAYDFEVNGIFYNKSWYNTATVEVTYKGDAIDAYDNEYSGAVTIPSEVTYEGTTYSVTKIGGCAFWCCSGLTSVEIPNSVTSIDNSAFFGCSGLTAVVIPNSVTEIGSCVFDECGGLTSVVIPNSITTIGFAAFRSCRSLTSVVIPNSVTSIDQYAFYGCSGLESITVESGNTVYDSRDNCNALIETATNTLLYGCKNTIIPNSVTSIDDYAFYRCSGLTSVEIPNSVTSIGSYAFSGCSGLTSVVIPNSVTSIGDSAFYYCDGLTSVVISNSVTSIGSFAFNSCRGLEIITVESGNKVYDSRDNCNALIETATNTLLSGCKNTIIPNSVTSIGSRAFYGCDGLTSVVIPNSVTEIGEGAFMGCDGLTSVEIPNSVTSIGSFAFNSCSGLTSVEIPNSVTSIGSRAFYYCYNLAMVFFNATNCTIGTSDEATYNTNCTFVFGENVTQLPDNLLSSLLSSNFSGKIVSLAAVPPAISATTFPSSATVYVSPDAYISYWMDENWGKMTIEEISIPVTSIALNAESLHITTTTKSASLEATVTPADATLKELYWTSSDPLIATVDQNGLVTRRREGSATITACAIDGSGAMATCQVTVDAIIAESLELSPAELSLSPNKSYRINAIYTPNDISSKNFEWSCSDEGVATFIKNLDGSITVTAIADGNATITCRTTDGSNLTATCEVTVVTESLELDPSEITLSKNKTAVIYPVFLPEGTPDRPCEWSCSDENIVKYKANSDGSITIIGATDGEAIITCHTTDGSDLTATCTVTVDTGTGVEGVSSTAAKVRAVNGAIRVEGAEGAQVEVFNTAGVCIYSGTDTEIYVPQRGLYVVKVADRATKIAL